METIKKPKIRPATPADVETIAGFNIAMASESESIRLDPEVVRAGVRLAVEDATRCHYFVADVEGETVGQIMVTFEWSDWNNAYYWWIQSVYVKPKFRRRGIFRALHGHVRELARNDPNVCALRLYVHKDNQRALQTYAELGMPLLPYLVCGEEWTAHRSNV